MENIEKNNELLVVVESSGLENKTSTTLKENFLPFFEQIEDWKKKAEMLIVTDATQLTEMKMAREARLAIRQIRISADKKRIALKEDSLKYGKAIQSIYNLIESKITPIEKHLELQEKFIEIQEENRKAEIRAKRQIEVSEYAEFLPLGIDLGVLSDEEYIKTLHFAKFQLEEKIKQEKIEEEQRILKEKAEKEEGERIRVENERLKKEKERIEAELKAQKDEIKRIEDELKSKSVIEKEPEKNQNTEYLSSTSDRENLELFAKCLINIPEPILNSNEAKEVYKDAKKQLDKLYKNVIKKSSLFDYF